MRFEDVKKLATGTVLFNLNRIISPRIVTILYFLGLVGIMVWAINHLFASFRLGFGNGLWGLLEIAVFGLLALIVLRIACEAVLVWFKAHATEAAEAERPIRTSGSLIDEVRDAIEELADQEPDDVQPAPPPPAPSTTPATPSSGPVLTDAPAPRPRTVKAKPKTGES